ncbi:vitamin B6 photo-protection and homoeostasis-domain-containing protein [Chytriomyces sp. MP71]|nr:vitamin B6 photo-protection and homoeostasis-domain-containing protein [Chytriomyces sp. MP71]
MWSVSRSTSGANDPAGINTSRLSLHPRAMASAVRDQLMVMFLPKGFPRSVTPDYLSYTIWQFLHSVSGTVTGTLSTQALLHALGLGAAASAGLAATTNWIIKDGFGLLGGVLYAGSVATKFDDQPKRFRFLSAALIQLSTLLELLTPLIPHLFVPIASISNIGKNIGWLASSASRAAIHRGFTVTDNLGDVTAKAGAQSTMAGLLGTVVGIGVSYFIGYSDPLTLLNVFLPLSIFNMVCCYQSNHVVVTRSLNVERAELALHRLVGALLDTSLATSTTTVASSPKHTALPVVPWTQDLVHRIAPLAVVSKSESFVRPYHSVLGGLPVLLEPPIAAHVARVRPHVLQALWRSQSENGDTGCRMMLSWRARAAPFGAATTGPRGETSADMKTAGIEESMRVCLWFLEASTPGQHFEGFWHACLARGLFLRRVGERGVEWKGSFEDMQVEFGKAVEDSRHLARGTFEGVREEMVRGGWHVEFNHFGDRDARIQA